MPHAHTHTQLFSCYIMFDSLRSHARPLCHSPSPGVCPSSCPLNPTISSLATLFSSCLLSFPASGSFLMSWLFAPGGQSIGASASVIPMNTQGWFALGLSGWISLLSVGLSKVFSSTTVRKHWFCLFLVLLGLGCSAQTSCCSGFSCGVTWAVGCRGFSTCSSQVLEHRLGSCGTWA